MTTDQTIRPQVPALSIAGRWVAVLALPWFFVSLLALDALGFIGGGSPPIQRFIALLVASVPMVTLVLHQWLGRLPGLRWLHHRVQPYLEIRPTGLVLQLRGVGARLYDWEDITGLRTTHGRGADLLGLGGVALSRIPENLLLRGGNWWRAESIASLVVRARPDRYRLSGANWAGVPTEFALRTSSDPETTDDQWANRRRLTTLGITLAFVLITGVIIVQYLTR